MKQSWNCVRIRNENLLDQMYGKSMHMQVHNEKVTMMGEISIVSQTSSNNDE